MLEHARKNALVVLHVGVHDGDVVGGGGEDAFDAGGRQAAAPDAMEQADAGVAPGVIADELGGVVGGVVVDEDEFPAEALKGGVDARDELRDVGAFVVGGDDERKVDAGRRRQCSSRTVGWQGRETHPQIDPFCWWGAFMVYPG